MKLKSGQKSISDEKCLNNDPIRKFNQKIILVNNIEVDK